MAPPSTFRPVSSMHYYESTIHSHEYDNPLDDNQPEHNYDSPVPPLLNTEYESQR